MSIVTEIMEEQKNQEPSPEVPVEVIEDTATEAQLQELDVQAQAVQNTVQSLEEIQEIIEDSLADGGLSDTEAVTATACANDAIDASDCDLERIDLPTMESAQTLAARRERTLLVMESIGERIKEGAAKLWELLLKFLKGIKEATFGRGAKVKAMEQESKHIVEKVREAGKDESKVEAAKQTEAKLKSSSDAPEFNVSGFCFAPQNRPYNLADIRATLQVLYKRRAVAQENLDTLRNALKGETHEDIFTIKPLSDPKDEQFSFDRSKRVKTGKVVITLKEYLDMANGLEGLLDATSDSLRTVAGILDKMGAQVAALRDKGTASTEFVNWARRIINEYQGVSQQLVDHCANSVALSKQYGSIYFGKVSQQEQ